MLKYTNVAIECKKCDYLGTVRIMKGELKETVKMEPCPNCDLIGFLTPVK
jgi:Zn finger protein HypA/HybF involved in hydrogenase expression